MINANVQHRKTNLHPVPKFGDNYATYLCASLIWIGAQLTVIIVVCYGTEGMKQLRLDAILLDRFRIESSLMKHLVVPLYNTVYRVIVGCLSTICQTLLLIATLSLFGADVQGGYLSLWVWFFYSSLCFLAMNSVLCVLFGVPTFQLASTFMLILQFATSEYPSTASCMS